MSLNESILEAAALAWFLLRQGFGGQVGDQPSPRLRPTGLGYAVGPAPRSATRQAGGPHLAPGEPAAERDGSGEVVLVGRLREAIRLNPAIHQSRTLAALRDTLLPKLLSGELSVAGAAGNPAIRT